MKILCPYCDAVTYSEIPRCKLINDYCFMVRRCSQVRWWLPIETPITSMKSCKIKKEKENMYKYKIRFMKHDILYVEYENTVITILNPFGDNIPQGVNEIVKIDETFYIKGYEPKIQNDLKNKKNTNVL